MASSHHNWGLLSIRWARIRRFYNLLGYTELLDNPDSWEGWHWGAIHAWGYYWKLGHCDNFDMLADALQEHRADHLLGGRPEQHSAGGYNGQDTPSGGTGAKNWVSRCVFIDPYCNCTAAHLGDKWIAPRPGTDAAMAEAIAYVWIKEGTYDKWFVENRTSVLKNSKSIFWARTDGQRRSTPQWAAEICDVPAHTIYRPGPRMGRQEDHAGRAAPSTAPAAPAAKPTPPNGPG